MVIAGNVDVAGAGDICVGPAGEAREMLAGTGPCLVEVVVSVKDITGRFKVGMPSHSNGLHKDGVLTPHRER